MTRIIIPHRGLGIAKTRLASVLSPDERLALARRLLLHVLEAAAASGAEVCVISPDPALGELVEPAGARMVVQRGMGLNAGLEQARSAALAEGIPCLAVLHGDLPNITPADVRALLEAVDGGRAVAIAPDRAGTGTNGLALRPADVIGFAFGPESFAAHRTAASAAGATVSVVERPGLAFDLDTPADLVRWLDMGDAA
ncbi:MAG: 2-phospho-L-lactate guanylyltransferase [Chloroflexi bacterium]|nr:MAG: 2-phospho-L-lactate guanylyltransferase [Chloroflexota bacterium]